jgi:hypothetical protein
MKEMSKEDVMELAHCYALAETGLCHLLHACDRWQVLGDSVRDGCLVHIRESLRIVRALDAEMWDGIRRAARSESQKEFRRYGRHLGQ